MKKKKPKSLKPLTDLFLYATSACGVVILFVAIMSANQKPIECPMSTELIKACEHSCEINPVSYELGSGDKFRVTCLCE